MLPAVLYSYRQRRAIIQGSIDKIVLVGPTTLQQYHTRLILLLTDIEALWDVLPSSPLPVYFLPVDLQTVVSQLVRPSSMRQRYWMRVIAFIET